MNYTTMLSATLRAQVALYNATPLRKPIKIIQFITCIQRKRKKKTKRKDDKDNVFILAE